MFFQTPFPHVLVRDFYSPEQLVAIKNEVRRLFSAEIMVKPGIHHGMNGQTTGLAVDLEYHCHINSIESEIIKIFRDKLAYGFINEIVNAFPQFAKLNYINSTLTKVRYYHDGENYGPHVDIFRDFLAFSYFHSHPKKFKGGELYCPDYHHKFSCDDNTFILLPGYIRHEVLTVKIENDDYWNGNGRYCISQFLSAVPNK